MGKPSSAICAAGRSRSPSSQLAVFFEGELVRREGAGDADGERAGLAQLGVGLAIAEEHVARGGGGGLFAAVDGDERCRRPGG